MMQSPTDKLVRMANQIGQFFKPQSEEKAIAGIVDHIKRFWEPRMKKRIFSHLDEGGGVGLDPLTLRALVQLKSEMRGFPTMAEAKAAAESPRA
jgi:formate dehydrogenase subunit delta